MYAFRYGLALDPSLALNSGLEQGLIMIRITAGVDGNLTLSSLGAIF